MFVWAAISRTIGLFDQFAMDLLEKARVMVTREALSALPDGYVRMALVLVVDILCKRLTGLKMRIISDGAQR
jgi:aspartate/methionine/tyrosine aminotransferase